MKLLALLLVLTTTALRAQMLPATDTLRWNVSGFRNLITNEDVTHVCTIVSRPDTVVWSQNGGASIDNFVVTSVDGTWSDTALDGLVTFHVTWGEYAGTLLFQRSDGTVKITMDIPKEGVNMAPFEFVVSEITKN